MYRYLFIVTGIKSAELVQKITYNVMLRYYPGLHTIDEDMAVDIICNDFKLKKIGCRYREEEHNMDITNADGTVIFIDEDTIDFEELIAEEEDDEYTTEKG